MVLSPPEHPLILVLEHDNGLVRSAYLVLVEALQGLHVTEKETWSLPDADGDLRRDLVWTVELLNPATREALTLWVTSLTSLSRGWMDLAPTAPRRIPSYRIVTSHP